MVLLIFNGGKRLLIKTFYLYNFFDPFLSMVLKPKEKAENIYFFLTLISTVMSTLEINTLIILLLLHSCT